MENTEIIYETAKIELGNRLRELRGEKSQKDIASLLSIKQSVYSEKELGKGNLTLDQVNILTSFYGVSYDYLINGKTVEYNEELIVTPKTIFDSLEARINEQKSEILFLRKQLEVSNLETTQMLEAILALSKK